MKLFQPLKSGTVSISVSSSSQVVKVANQTSGQLQVRVMNNGTATVWIAFGDSTVTASTTADTPIAPGYTGGFTVNVPTTGPLYMAAIAAGSTGSIYATPGVGV